MYKNTKTYTYTARNAEDPDNVVTFTIDEERLRVNLTDLMEPPKPLSRSTSRPRQALHQVKTKTKPVFKKLREKVFGPVHISDVDAKLTEDKFLVRMWPRVAGLRVAPLRINMGQVDNEDAAEAFVDELDYRKETVPAARKLIGPLDYWFGWAGLMLLVGLFVRSRYRQQQSVG
jgi:hypothetical protein